MKSVELNSVPSKLNYLQDLADRLGFKIKFVNKIEWPDYYTSSKFLGVYYSGKSKTLFVLKEKLLLVPFSKGQHILHEIGHFIAASPRERKKDNYGLDEKWVARAQQFCTDKVEIDACRIQLALTQRFLSHKTLMKTALYLNLIGSDTPFKSLEQKKFRLNQLIKSGNKLIKRRSPEVWNII